VSWRRERATGDVPPSTSWPAAVVCGNVVYIFGGNRKGNKRTNEVFSVTTSGEFVRLRLVGAVPSPRDKHRGWCYDGAIYFLGGEGPKADSGFLRRSRPALSKGDWQKDTTEPGIYSTNQLLKLDLSSSSFSLHPTSGTPPSPRACFAVAQVNENVFVQGGLCDGVGLRDFHHLNMATGAWSQLKESGPPRSLRNHTLSPISENGLLLVGGGSDGTPTKEVWRCDVTSLDWTREADLSDEFVGGEEGLMCHRAVSLKKEGQVTNIVILGGYLDIKLTRHPRHVLNYELF
jgi:hypothetical protein